ncbi:MAG: hypothetical protein EX260_08980 [Desulfobulbaceae bacterium]|nr:MAG: hypothetical protein EX260_08980 [Desulfobulbaceae bacterium]
MNYQNSIRILSHGQLDTKIRQQLRRKKTLGFPGGTALWLAASKFALVLVFIAFCINLWLNFAITRGEQQIQSIEAARHQLNEDQIVLLAQRANLMSEKQVLKRAGEELALFVPGEKQVFKLR